MHSNILANMEILLFLLFSGWCITSGIINGTILDPLRNWTLVRMPIFGKLLTCIRCLGFWVGFVLFGFLTCTGTLGPIIPGTSTLMNYILLPFIQSGSGVIIESAVIFLMRDRKNIINNDITMPDNKSPNKN